MEKRNSKPTNAQLLRRIQKSPLHLDFTKNTVSLYFSDKGLRLTVDDAEGYTLIATGYHTHYFQNWTSQGVSRPYLYTKRVIEIANENLKDIEVDGGYSFQRLLEVLNAKEDQTDYQLAWYVDKYFYNLHMCLYEINETEAGSFLVYERFMHNIARQSFLLEEHKEDVTNKQFVDKVLELEASFMKDIDERVILEAKTDEQRMQEEISAIQEQEVEQTVQEGTNGAE